MDRVKVGDKICVKRFTFEVAEIISQDVWTDWENGEESKIPTYYLEFFDPKGGYHYWKSNIDGGYIIRA